jgi:hypothetical protein
MNKFVNEFMVGMGVLSYLVLVGIVLYKAIPSKRVILKLIAGGKRLRLLLLVLLPAPAAALVACAILRLIDPEEAWGKIQALPSFLAGESNVEFLVAGIRRAFAAVVSAVVGAFQIGFIWLSGLTRAAREDDQSEGY